MTILPMEFLRESFPKLFARGVEVLESRASGGDERAQRILDDVKGVTGAASLQIDDEPPIVLSASAGVLSSGDAPGEGVSIRIVASLPGDAAALLLAEITKAGAFEDDEVAIGAAQTSSKRFEDALAGRPMTTFVTLRGVPDLGDVEVRVGFNVPEVPKEPGFTAELQFSDLEMVQRGELTIQELFLGGKLKMEGDYSLALQTKERGNLPGTPRVRYSGNRSRGIMFRAIAKSRYLVPGFLCFALAFVVGPVGVASGVLAGAQGASIAGVVAAVLGVLGLLIIASGLPASIDVEEVDAQIRSIHDEIEQVEDVIGENVKALSSGLGEQMVAVEETARALKSMAISLQAISDRVEALSSSTEESASSILQMTATNHEVAENMGNLGSSVRETASSIEEMTYSIKEVARNVDGLALTAEETSSSMNEMDVSIGQVQSNANETARLSE
ncbi:MAG: methyl-accepting chemotaxis protein, partial [Deltaproteobacteria bacterium]|nr:methyl-accepting chemotaxis protein [Deltaproteobacteria bacterium]